jgi:hypothetical protein
MPAPTETLKLDNKIQEKMAAIQCHESELALTKPTRKRQKFGTLSTIEDYYNANYYI